ncbi:MAG: BACON domain-containing protein [Bacteroidales bacterium]|nr:BACON domain-containing protein [Bacteroidales bacterium]
MKFTSKILSLVAVAGLMVFSSCKKEIAPANPYFTIEGDKTSISVDCLGASAGSPIPVTIRSNQQWKFIPMEDYDWVKVFPEDGGKGDGIIRFVVNTYTGMVDRSALFTILVDGKEYQSVFTVTQEKDSPRVRFSESTKTINKTAASYTVDVLSNTEWTVSCSETWISGVEKKDDKVSFSVEENATYNTRDGKITVTATQYPEVVAVLTVKQEGIGAELEGLKVEWLFNATEMAKYQTPFLEENALPANVQGVGFIGYVRGEKGIKADVNNKFAKTVGSTGHPYITGAWPDDYFLFSVPTVNIPAGTIISISYITRVSATGHKYWNVEVFDGDDWCDMWEGETIEEKISGRDTTFKANITMFPDGSTNVAVNAKYTYKKNTNVGKIMIRQRCAFNTQASGTGPLSAPNSGTVRIAGAEGTSPVIACLYVGDGTGGDVPETKFEIEGIEDNTILFPAEPSVADTVAFKLKVSRDWTLTTADNWIKFSPENGVKDEVSEIKVIVDTNATAELRKGAITIVGGPFEKRIVVVQAPPSQQLEPLISVIGGNTIDIDGTEFEFPVSVQANVPVEVEIADSWITEVPTLVKAASVEVISKNFKATMNDSGAERRGTIRFYNTEENIESVLTVVQPSFAFPSNIVYYETAGVVSATTTLDNMTANKVWKTLGSGAATVTYSGGSKVDVRATCNQGSTTSSGTYTTYDVAYIPGYTNSNLGNIYFGNDTAEGLPNSFFYVNDITIASGIEALQLGLGLYGDIVNCNDNHLEVAYKFDNETDWTSLDDLVASKNWKWTETEVFAVPSGATKVTLRFHSTIKQIFRIDDLTLIERSASEVIDPYYAEWLFTADTYKAGTHGATWDLGNSEEAKTAGTHGKYASANIKGNGKIEYYSIDKTALDTEGKFTMVVGSTGHPYVTGVQVGDYFQFTVTPTKTVKAGTKINVDYISRISATGMRYWVVEWYDGDTWVPAFPLQTVTVSGKDSPTGQAATVEGETKTVDVTYNVELTTATSNTHVNFDAVYTKEAQEVVVRMRCVSNYTGTANVFASKPTGGTCRIAGAAGTSPVIKTVK